MIFYLSRDGNFAIYGESPVNLNVPEFTSLDVTIAPNPATNLVTVQTDNILNNVTIYSVLGDRIMSSKNATNTFDVSLLSKGVYFIEIISGQQRSVQKLIKK